MLSEKNRGECEEDGQNDRGVVRAEISCSVTIDLWRADGGSPPTTYADCASIQPLDQTVVAAFKFANKL